MAQAPLGRATRCRPDCPSRLPPPSSLWRRGVRQHGNRAVLWCWQATTEAGGLPHHLLRRRSIVGAWLWEGSTECFSTDARGRRHVGPVPIPARSYFFALSPTITFSWCVPVHQHGGLVIGELSVSTVRRVFSDDLASPTLRRVWSTCLARSCGCRTGP